MKLHNLLSFLAPVAIATILPTTLHSAQCGNSGDETDGCPCDESTSNSSHGDHGPRTHSATSSYTRTASTTQNFITPFRSSARNQATDLEIFRNVGEIPLSFTRTYQSRAQPGMGDTLGHGLTWGHNFAWRMSTGAYNHVTLAHPDGRAWGYMKTGTVTFEGSTQSVYNQSVGVGERIYQGGPGGNTFTAIFADGTRQVFERVTVDGVTLYHPRYGRDNAGRQINYTSDAKGRIISATIPGGSSISLEYAPIQINRKNAITLHEVTAAPLEDWNEIILTNPQPYRWLQARSAPNAYFNIAEIEYYTPDGNGGHTRISGQTYGTNVRHFQSPGSTFTKVTDGDISTGYYHTHGGGGIVGIDLGFGNEKPVSKIRFRPLSSPVRPIAMSRHVGLRFESLTEEPAIIDVLQRVSSSDGREVNYLYDTITDPTIGQSHLVLSGVDYDGDQLATSDTDARFTYTYAHPGGGPSVETFYEPRTTHNVPHLKIEYYGLADSTRGQARKALNPENGELIVENKADVTRQIILPGNRRIKIDYGARSLFERITDADGNSSTYTYDAKGFMASMTDQAGRTTTYTHNFRGQRLTTTYPDGQVETTTYDSSGRVASATLSAPGHPNRVTTWIRDAIGQVTRKNYPDGSYETYTYNTLGLVTSKRERNSSITTRTYDATGLALTFTQATGTPEEETVSYTFYGNNDPTGSPARLLKSETDPRGRTTSFIYNLRGDLTQTTYPDGSSRSYAYDFAGNKISETDGIHTQSWTYNDYKQKLTATDPLGHTTSYYYGDGGIDCGCYNNGGPTLIISPEGRTTLREYDKQWRVSKETIGLAAAIPGKTPLAPVPATTEYFYDIVGNLSMKVLPGGVTHTATFDVRDRTLTQTVTGPDGRGGNLSLTTAMAYDPFGNTISVTKPGNRTTTMTYDVMERTATMTDALGTTTSYTYDSADNQTAITEDLGGPLARTTTMAYDLLNRPVLTTFPDATTNSATYHKGGAIHTGTDVLNRTTSSDDSLVIWSDSAGNTWQSFVATSTDALGQTSSNHPKPVARFAGTTMSVSAMGRISEQHHNADGTTAKTIVGLTAAGSAITQDPTVTTYTYDDDHLLLSSSTLLTANSALLTSYTYDARGNRLTSKDPLNRITKTTYDLRSNPVETELQDGRKHLAVFDALNRRVSTTDPKNQTITYTFLQETGQTLTLKDAKNQVTTWTYNALDQILTKAYPNGDTHTYTYDSLHRMATHRTPKLEICTYTYDLRDRHLKSDWNTTTPDTTKTYFANGLLKSIDNGISKSDYAYSVRNELTVETQTLANQAAKVVSYSYDADGLRSQMTSPSGAPIAYNWTAKTQLKDISRDGPPPLATYGYDAAGRLLTTAHENGITEVKTYNAASELLSNAHSGGGLNPPSQHTYTYDSTGRRTAETRTGTLPATNTYGYDTADQVTSADYGNSQTDTYAYDPMGNRTTARSAAVSATPITYTTNSANQYTSITNLAPPIHDANGNLTSQGGVTYTWDSENRLLSTTDGTTTNSFTYDANHRRVTKRTAVNGTVTEKTHFIYDGWNVIEERTNTDTTPGFNLGTFTLSKELTWGTDLSGSLQGAGGVGGLLLITDHSAPGTYYHHYDGNGNVTQVTTNTGSTAATYRYDAFGNALQATGTYALSNTYRFSTTSLDAEITTAPLYYYGYRYYDPQTGRWPSRDPIGEEGGVNLYKFVGNDGLNNNDMLGLFSCDKLSDVGNVQYHFVTIPKKGIARNGPIAVTFPLKYLAKKGLVAIVDQTAAKMVPITGLFGIDSTLNTVKVDIIGLYRCCICVNEKAEWDSPVPYSEEVNGGAVYHLPSDQDELRRDIVTAMKSARETAQSACAKTP